MERGGGFNTDFVRIYVMEEGGGRQEVQDEDFKEHGVSQWQPYRQERVDEEKQEPAAGEVDVV